MLYEQQEHNTAQVYDVMSTEESEKLFSTQNTRETLEFQTRKWNTKNMKVCAFACAKDQNAMQGNPKPATRKKSWILQLLYRTYIGKVSFSVLVIFLCIC